MYGMDNSHRLFVREKSERVELGIHGDQEAP